MRRPSCVIAGKNSIDRWTMALLLIADRGQGMLELRGYSAVVIAVRTLRAPLPFLFSRRCSDCCWRSPLGRRLVCTWNQNGAGQWDNPSNWDNCSAGNGSPAGTPGSADHAIVGNTAPLADVDMGSTPHTLDRLSLSAGRIFWQRRLDLSAPILIGPAAPSMAPVVRRCWSWARALAPISAVP